MTHRALISLFLRQFVLALAVLCLFGQALVPSGFMLAPGGDGFPVSIVICGQGKMVPAADLGLAHASDEAPGDESRNPGPCAFAGLSPAAAPSGLVASVAAPHFVTQTPIPPGSDRALLSVGANAPPPSRAPPISV